MVYSFTVECEDYYGLATTYAYVGPHHEGVSMNNNCIRLKSLPKLRCCFDTGANHTTMSSNLAYDLGILPDRQSAKIATPLSAGKLAKYHVDICLPGDIVLVDWIIGGIPHIDSVQNNPVIDLLIGMDIIGLGDFALTHRNGKSLLSFRIPHSIPIDFQKL